MKYKLPSEFGSLPAYDGKSEIPEYWVNHKFGLLIPENNTTMRHEIIGPFPDTATFLPLKAHLERLGEKVPFSTIPPGDSIYYDERFGEWVRGGRPYFSRAIPSRQIGVTDYKSPTITPSEFIRKYRGVQSGQGTWEN